MEPMHPPSRAAGIPAELKDRLSKADGHINAAERRLWMETERGLWSAHQAVARIAEVWLKIEGHVAELPKVERYLPSEVKRSRIEALEEGAGSGPLGDAWTEQATAEAAIRAEPFTSRPWWEDRASLEAGLERKHRYLDAIRNLQRVVEDSVAARYVTLGLGDWALLPDYHVGCMFDRRGLTGQFLLPDIAVTTPSRGIRLYNFGYAVICRIHCPRSAPVESPAWYWLADAERRWDELHRLLTADWLTLSALYTASIGLLDSASKAWWIAFDPSSCRVSWEHTNPEGHVGLLEGRAPEAIADPLNTALKCTEDLHREGISAGGGLPTGGGIEEVSTILCLVRKGLSALENLLEHEVDPAPGEWIDFADREPERIVVRDGRGVFVDLGEDGVLAESLFATPFPCLDPWEEFSETPRSPYRARWLWFDEHPEACLGRTVCPCCGLPGVRGNGGCGLCGWTHDGGSFGWYRRSRIHTGLDLDLGRRRFEALGYAVPPRDASLGHRTAWLDPLVLAIKRRLVAALDDLARCYPDDTGKDLDEVRVLWRSYEERLAAGVEDGGSRS